MANSKKKRQLRENLKAIQILMSIFRLLMYMHNYHLKLEDNFRKIISILKILNCYAANHPM